MLIGRYLLATASAGAVVLGVRSVVVGPLPLGWSLAFFAAYALLVTAGVLDLRLQMFTEALVHGPRNGRGVALTFDDGPDPTWTPRVLDMLDSAKVQGTFFVIGQKAEKHPELVREIVRRGHLVGLHGYAHPRLFALHSHRRVRADLERAIAVLFEITGQRTSLFRPPIGHTNLQIARAIRDLDLTVVGWSVSGRDGVRWSREAEVVARVSRRLRPGAIVLLHDAAERQDFPPVGPSALQGVLRSIAEKGLEVVPLRAWLPSSVALVSSREREEAPAASLTPPAG